MPSDESSAVLGRVLTEVSAEDAELIRALADDSSYLTPRVVSHLPEHPPVAR